ncbi:MAG: DNA recombination protein RmuC [Actinobacteria bacterium]|nr:MAG: DNA recombination protein RmuC [Actinomycetota bacterium]
MLAIATLLLVLAGAGALAVWLTRALQVFKADSDATLAARNAEVGRQLEGITATMDRRLGELDTKVDRRMEHASKQTNAIHKQLGDVGRATTLLAEHAKELGQLQQVLRPPKARGGFGELLLGNLLRDRLPAEAYSLQYGLKSGERVDAVIRVDRLAPIDAKFPLDNFERLVDAQENSERELHEKAFARDVKGLPVSPTTLTAYLQVVVLGLKGLQIEQHAHEVMAYCAQLQKDFGRFKEDFDLVGTHLGRAQTKFVDAEKRLDKFETKLDQAADSREVDAADVVAELPRAADAAA